MKKPFWLVAWLLVIELAVVFVLVPLLVWVAFFADFEDSAKEKAA